DFPQPDGPTMLANSPSPIVKLMSLRTINSACDAGSEYLLISPSTVMAEEAVLPGFGPCRGKPGSLLFVCGVGGK
ncbi:MAG TPA: hypothetical protein VMU69_04905, partial [Bradyrhizobium sp.]|nr:hypothetical protein [Bradyrhizobium sp.]